MTLETAKCIKQEYSIKDKDSALYKEAEAILRGGMNICEIMDDGSRKYIWIKVTPTKSDKESSVKAAMEQYRMRTNSCIMKGPNTTVIEPKTTEIKQIQLQQGGELEKELEVDNIFTSMITKLKKMFH